MATFETRVEGLTGLSIDSSSDPTQAELSQFLTDGVNDVINRLQMINPGAISLFASQTAVGASGSYIDGDILGVYGDESSYKRVTSEVPATTKGLLTDTDSLYYQSVYNPVFYREGKKVTIVPNGGTVIHITKPSVNYADETILEVPEQYYHLICLYASVRALSNALAGKDSLLPTYTSPGEIQIPSFSATLPSNLTVPNFPYISTELKSVTSGTSITRTSIDTSIPSYVNQPLTIPTLLAINDITMPTVPAAPIASDISLSFNPATDKPVYNAQSLSLPAFPSFSDFALTGTAASPPSAVIVPTLVAETISTHSIGTLPAPPIYSTPKVLGATEELMETAPTIADEAGLTTLFSGGKNLEDALETAWTYVQDEEDAEMSGAVGNFISTVVNLYSTQMTNNLNDYNSRVQEYQQEVQKVMQQAQMDRAKKDKQSDMNWQAAVGQYEKTLAKHQADVALYQADVSKQVQEWQMNNLTYKMAKWNSEVGHAISEHSANMTNELNKFNERDKLYQKTWEKAVQDATLSGQNVANDLAEFDKAMSKYTQEVNTTVQEYQQNELLKKWEVYKFDYQQAVARHAAEMADANSKFNSDNTKLQTEMTIAQANAGNVQAALMAQMASDTELAKHNSMQEFTSNLTKFQQDLANYQAHLSKYTNEISTQQSEYSQVLAKYGQDLADAMNEFNTALQKRDKEYTWMQGRLQQLTAEYNQGIGLMAQPQQQGEA